MLAQRSPDFAFFSLAHYIDLQWLEEAYRRTRKDGAAGVDDVTGKEYAEHLYDNLQHLLDRLKTGTYWGPVRRQDITGKAIRIYYPFNRVREIE